MYSCLKAETKNEKKMKTLKMKNQKWMLAAVIVLIASLVMVSCEKNEDLTQPSTDDVALLEKEVVNTVPDYNYLEEPLLSEPAIDEDFVILDDGMPGNIEEGFKKDSVIFGKRKIYLKHLFDTLNLTDEQKAKLIWAMQAHHKCVYSLMIKLRHLNREIVAGANKIKWALILKYKNGDITLAELKAALLKLRNETIYKLKNNPVRKALIKGIINCHKEYMENVRLILTKEQWKLWLQFHHRFYNDSQNGN